MAVCVALGLAWAVPTAVMENLDPPKNGPPGPDISKYLDPHGTNISGIG